jgi:hypothetical protein
MNHRRAHSLDRSSIVGVSIAISIFATTLAHAQRKPIVVEPGDAVAAASVKARSLINRPGSYVLAGNLVNGKAGAIAVFIASPDVTLDLQGFSIICNASNTGAAIDATGQANVVIRNGTIVGCGGPAVIAGTAANISGITASENGSGFICGIGCVARDNVIQDNMGIGMTFSDATGGYIGNVLQGNDGNTVGTTGQVSGGTSLSHNLCNGVAC